MNNLVGITYGQRQKLPADLVVYVPTTFTGIQKVDKEIQVGPIEWELLVEDKYGGTPFRYYMTADSLIYIEKEVYDAHF